MKTLLLLVLLGLAVAAPTADDKTVGGYECSKQDAPWIVVLTDGFYVCNGALIHPRWVVSAADCPLWSIQARLGQRAIMATVGSVQLFDAEMMITHPKYDYYTRDNGIMLIKLSRAATMNRNVVAVPLPTQCVQTGDMCLISGWGRAWDPAVRGYQLKCLDTPVMSDADCRRFYPGIITDNMMCLAYLGGSRRRCEGNPGGPVVCNGVLQGVVSWGYGCKVRDPGLHARVCNYVSWIHNTIAAN